MIRRLTDADIRREPAYFSLIEEHCGVIREMGWSEASLVEQYNLIVSLCC